LNLNELRELLTTINQMDITELSLKSDDFELNIRRGLRPDEHLLLAGMPQVAAPGGVVAASPQMVMTAATPVGVDLKSIPDAAGISLPATLPPGSERRWVEILSPMVGTFYRAPAPDEPPFVETGDRIRSGQTVCIIEAMKLMNEIEAEVAGELIEILVENGQPVEYNQPLMRVIPG
jgi:acetyl-CoA carboxylase biotin carboxyl carrier protein